MNSWLIDTNVLIYSFDQTCPLHAPSYQFIERSITANWNLFISHQNLLEFFAVVTNPRRVEHPLSIEDAFQKIAVYVSSFTLIAPLRETFFTFTRLLTKYSTFRERIFDLYLVATALDNGVNQICTWNIKDFKRFSEITAKTPEQILQLLMNE